MKKSQAGSGSEAEPCSVPFEAAIPGQHLLLIVCAFQSRESRAELSHVRVYPCVVSVHVCLCLGKCIKKTTCTSFFSPADITAW